MVDLCLRAGDRSAHLEVAVAITTRACRAAHEAHGYATTSAIGLGRLLTATGLVALTSKRRGTTSIQVLSRGRLKQLYADATERGEVRGFSKNAALTYPPVPSKPRSGRLSIAAVVVPGEVSVVRSNARGEYIQSATPLTSGEIDRDVESFLVQSDQIPTVVACETLIDVEGEIELAGGVIVQAMPDAELDALYEIRDRIVDGRLASLLYDAADAEALLAAVAPNAELVEDPAQIVWKCRCSFDRVIATLEMLPPTDLAEMVDQGEGAQVDCDFCARHYDVSPERVLQIFASKIKAQG